jgi:hypothetical protein
MKLRINPPKIKTIGKTNKDTSKANIGHQARSAD